MNYTDSSGRLKVDSNLEGARFTRSKRLQNVKNQPVEYKTVNNELRTPTASSCLIAYFQ